MAKAPKAAATKKPAAPRKDKAQRPSPPDRDGDGASGGSLRHNETVDAAKGTAEHVLAEQQIAADGLATIIITGVTTGKGHTHPVGVNGRIRHIALNVEVQVDAGELAVLEASQIEYTVVVPLAAPAESADAAAGVEGSASAADAEPPPPAPELPPEGTVEPVVETEQQEQSETVTQPEGETPAA
jgi:hypothetical protein